MGRGVSSSAIARPTPAIGHVEFIVMMAAMQALMALGVDAMLPALGRIAADLAIASPNQRQLVVGLYLIALGVGALLPGPLADRFGRRRLALACIAGYVGFALVAAVAGSFLALLAARAAMGFVSAGLTVLPAAIIRDRFDGDRMAQLQSLVGTVFMIVPMLAPSIGQAVLLVAGWRWIFGGMALAGASVAGWVALRLPETLHPAYRQPLRMADIGHSLRWVLTTRAAMGYVFGLALVQGALFGYINSSQQLVAEHFGAGARFPLIFAGMALAIAVANLINSRIVDRFGARRVSHAALMAYIVVSAGQVVVAFSPADNLWRFVPLASANLMLMGFLGANFTAIALQPFAAVAGTAASAQGFVRTVLATLLGAAIGQAYDGSARPLAIALLLAGLGTLALVLFSEHGRLFRRLHPRGGDQIAPSAAMAMSEGGGL